MILIDFIYDGLRLSDMGCMPCYLEDTEGTVDVGNSLNWNTVRPPRTNSKKIVSTGYGDDYAPVISIIKNPCKDDTSEFTDQEINKIMRWLNQKTYCRFTPIYDDGSFLRLYYNASFNVQLVRGGAGVIGFTLTMTTDAPYAYKFERIQSGMTEDKSVEINDDSDEISFVYADVAITCQEAGDLVITNSLDSKNPIEIKNVSAQETILLKGKTKIIQTDFDHPMLFNDFNYNFLRIGNTKESNKNVISTNLPVHITIEYSPIRKVGLV